MAQYRYVIVNSTGASFFLYGDPEYPVEEEFYSTRCYHALPRALAEGWKPVRETPMSGGENSLSFSLVLLRKETAEMTPASGESESLELSPDSGSPCAGPMEP